MDELTKQAETARKEAYVPYSKFAVGAAVLAEDGQVYTGCNIENSAFGVTICAERVAIFKAISKGNRHLNKIAVVADTKGPVSPCGACRQVMTEFMNPDGEITLSNLHGDHQQFTVEEILPFYFSLNEDRHDNL